jgi:hypothetical protein
LAWRRRRLPRAAARPVIQEGAVYCTSRQLIFAVPRKAWRASEVLHPIDALTNRLWRVADTQTSSLNSNKKHLSWQSKTSISGTYHEFDFNKYSRRYMGAFSYMTNRRFGLSIYPAWLQEYWLLYAIACLILSTNFASRSFLAHHQALIETNLLVQLGHM